MGLFNIFLLMILCHIIDDFVLQPICLSKLKKKSWWEENAPNPLYKDDYKVGLFIHSLSWSIMIILPVMFLWTTIPWLVLLITIAINCGVHYIVDDAKANKKKINLATDQKTHLLQILVTFIMLVAFK